MALRALTVTAVLLGWTCAAQAQQLVRLEFNEGTVTLSARDAPLRAILAEWARLGGATVVNGDRVAGPPLTLELTAVPERQALDVLLRGVPGYMIAPRRAESSGLSMFDRVLILPTSTPPGNPAPAVATRPGPQRPAFLARPPWLDTAPSDGNQNGADSADEQDVVAAGLPQPPIDPFARPRIQRSPADPNTLDAEEPEPGVVTPQPPGPQRLGPARVR